MEEEVGYSILEAKENILSDYKIIEWNGGKVYHFWDPKTNRTMYYNKEGIACKNCKRKFLEGEHFLKNDQGDAHPFCANFLFCHAMRGWGLKEEDGYQITCYQPSAEEREYMLSQEFSVQLIPTCKEVILKIT